MPSFFSSLLKVSGGAGVVALSFWITLTILRTQQPIVPPGPITVVEATYGFSCDGVMSPTRTRHEIKVGNATKNVADKCNGKMNRCVYSVDVSELGDPANACSKDFVVRWHCRDAVKIHATRLADEASGKSAVLECQDE
jgi:hypothetical protein